jgi:hypothetical protein
MWGLIISGIILLYFYHAWRSEQINELQIRIEELEEVITSLYNDFQEEALLRMEED